MCEVDKKLKQLISQILGKDIEEKYNKEQCNLIDDLGIDSMGLIQLIVNIESSFNIEFSDEDMYFERLTSLDSLKKVIFDKKSHS